MSKILVVGDIILDEYVYGKIERISPEAPIPVFDPTGKTERKLGGAANVAANIKSLDPDSKVEIIGYCNLEASTLLSKKIIPLTDRCYDYSALKKTRYVVGTQQVLRVDYPKTFANSINIDELTDEELLEYDLIVVSDYNKGTIGSSVLNKLARFSRKKCVLVESKNARRYFGFDNIIYKCNEKEWELQKDVVKHSAFRYVVVTKSEKGWQLTSSNWSHAGYSVVDKDSIVDVVGAGDVFLAGMAVELAKGSQIRNACEFGNKAAGESVKHFGTVEVKKEWLENDE